MPTRIRWKWAMPPVLASGRDPGVPGACTPLPPRPRPFPGGLATGLAPVVLTMPGRPPRPLRNGGEGDCTTGARAGAVAGGASSEDGTFCFRLLAGMRVHASASTGGGLSPLSRSSVEGSSSGVAAAPSTSSRAPWPSLSGGASVERRDSGLSQAVAGRGSAGAGSVRRPRAAAVLSASCRSAVEAASPSRGS